MDAPLAMISYSWADAEAAELLHDELALRGFRVIHDRHTFTEGSRIPANMTAGVDTCDVFVAYLTRHSLYLDRSPGEPQPALTGELRPALRRRRSNIAPGQADSPIVVLLPHGLGDREAAAEIIRQVTGERVDTLWSIWLDQNTDVISQDEAARVADNALEAFLQREPPRPPINLFVATRGTTPPPRRFTIDGTRLFGGRRRPGHPTDWARLFAALQSVRRHLETVSGGGAIRIEMACHLSAAFATGRIFHQATRWSPVFGTRRAESTPARKADPNGLACTFDPYADSGDLFVEIDLIGHDVAALTDQLAARLPPAGGRISVIRSTTGDLSDREISQLALATADRIRAAHAAIRPERMHFTMAAPAGYSALLGYHLTALQADFVTYELAETGYAQALTLPGTTP